MIEVTDEDKSEYKKLSRRINKFYADGSNINLHGLSRFDEEKGEWKPVLKRKLY